ncbi:MAG: GAF domain-containing protein [Acidobacteriota bacterium]|nr:GAF domain-containing protein [Acidobacteriota bacterium]
MGDAAKLIERAEKLLEKGKPELALAEFRSAVDLEPTNEALLRKTADLSTSLAQLGIASDMLRRLFAAYVENKQLGEAGLAYRRLQRLKALEPEMVFRYAELCEATNRRDAAEAYRVAFEEFHRLGDPRRSLDSITRAVDLDPRLEDYREQARIAEALHERALASSALVRLGVMLERSGQDASKAYEQAYQDDSNNMAARLGHGSWLVRKGRPAEAIELLQPLASYPSSPEEAREPYALALLAVGRVEDAEPYIWGIFERDPKTHLETLHEVIGGLLDRDRVEKALGLARRLEEYSRKAGRRLQFMSDMAQLAGQHRASIPFLEYLAELYNSANREVEYAQMLAHLFDAYFAAGNFARALDALDRAVDIDSYDAEHKRRLDKLAGHAPEDRLQVLAKRLGVEAPAPVTAVSAEEAEEAPAPKVLEDLILQAEIFLQYGMRDKAVQKIEHLKQAFAEEISGNARVRQLFINAGLPAPAEPENAPSGQTRVSEEMVRSAEVSRMIARQTDPRSVLVTAVNQIGARWQYSRCLAALATPGKPPSLVVEYCSPEVAKSERAAMVRLLALSQRLTSVEPVFRAADVSMAEALMPIRHELDRLGITSLAVVALITEDTPIGLLIVQQCGARRRWSPEDMELLRSLADQMALAVHGARLRSLVSTLGVAEEKTGLLKRSAYTDSVLSELRRERDAQAAPGTLALLQVNSLTSESQDEQAISEMVRTLRSIAQDEAMAFRYERDTVALLLPQMQASQVEVLVNQLREALEPIAVTIIAGIAPGPGLGGFEPEDAATEWINRVVRSLALAGAAAKQSCILPPSHPSTV